MISNFISGYLLKTNINNVAAKCIPALLVTYKERISLKVQQWMSRQRKESQLVKGWNPFPWHKWMCIDITVLSETTQVQKGSQALSCIIHTMLTSKKLKVELRRPDVRENRWEEWPERSIKRYNVTVKYQE